MKLPNEFKGAYYSITKVGESYTVRYMSSGHSPNVQEIQIPENDAQIIFDDPDKFEEIITQAEMKRDGLNK